MFIDACKRKILREKGFFGGYYLKKKRGLAYSGVHSEKLTYQILLLFNSALLEYFLDMRKYLVRGPNNGSIYIYSERNFNSSMPARGRFSGKRVSLGDIIFYKTGLGCFGVTF